jgi:hypothetical protein
MANPEQCLRCKQNPRDIKANKERVDWEVFSCEDCMCMGPTTLNEEEISEKDNI